MQKFEKNNYGKELQFVYGITLLQCTWPTRWRRQRQLP